MKNFIITLKNGIIKLLSGEDIVSAIQAHNRKFYRERIALADVVVFDID